MLNIEFNYNLFFKRKGVRDEKDEIFICSFGFMCC